MPARPHYFAKPSPTAEEMITNTYGVVPRDLYSARVTKRSRASYRSAGDPKHCFICNRPIHPGDWYLVSYKPRRVGGNRTIDIYLCDQHIIGMNSYFGDGEPWPGAEHAAKSQAERERGGTPYGGFARSVSVTEHGCTGPVRAAEDLTKARDLTERLNAQGWRCAYPCADGREGRPLLPGEAIARAYDNVGIVHLDCAASGTVPAEGNPWLELFDNGRR